MTHGTLDRSAIQELVDTTGEVFAKELVATFLADAPGMLAELSSAFKAGDQDQFRRAAHSIKSNASIFGATALADQARALELSGFSDDAGQDADAIAELDRAYENAAAQLKVFQNA